MSAKGSLSFYKLRSLLQFISPYSSSSSNVSSDGYRFGTELGRGYGIGMPQGLKFIGGNLYGGKSAWRKVDANMVKDDKIRQPVPSPPRPNFPKWAIWIVGSILSILVPFWKQKWENFKRIEGEAEMVIKEVEKEAEVVEEVATMAEKVSAEVAEKFPEIGKLRETALLVERVSRATAHDAQLTEEFIHKLDALKHDLGDLETMVEPVTEKIIRTTKNCGK